MLDYFNIDWPNILKLDEKNVNSVTNNSIDTINSVLNKYAPLKTVKKYKLRFKKTFGLLLLFKNQDIIKTNYQKNHQRLFLMNSIKHTKTYILHQ